MVLGPRSVVPAVRHGRRSRFARRALYGRGTVAPAAGATNVDFSRLDSECRLRPGGAGCGQAPPYVGAGFMRQPKRVTAAGTTVPRPPA